jgi:polynucleotide 5'-kinase involved in rRNA processing
VAIQHDCEVEPILAHVPHGTTVHRLRPEPLVRSRSSEERRALRERKFAGYFEGAAVCPLDLRRVAPERPAMCKGRRIAPSRVVADVPPEALRGLLVGLTDRRGTIMAMGTIAEVAPAPQRLSVAAPGVSPDAVRFVQWGRLSVTPEGREAGRLSDRHGVSA